VAVPIKRVSGRSHARLRIAVLLAGVSLSAVAAHAQDATWLGNTPGNPTDWNTDTNWSNNSPPPLNVVPLGTATFGATGSATVTFSELTTTIQALQFNTGAQQYLFDIGLCGCQDFHITGTGITNFSSFRPVFTVEGLLSFENASTAGNANITNRLGGFTSFNGSSSAGSASIVNRFQGATFFYDFSSAGSASIVNRFQGATFFYDFSSAGSASIVNRFQGATFFYDFSSAGNATITTNNGGLTQFVDNSTGGNARFVTNAGGLVDFSGSTGPAGDGKITAGSIEGAGDYFIGGGNTLIVGSNNLSTEVSGVIADGCGCTPGPGSLVKVGSGTLILSRQHLYRRHHDQRRHLATRQWRHQRVDCR
jgi:hypothetical protein